MENELLLAIKEEKATKGVTLALCEYLSKTPHAKVISDFENALQLQREKCAEEAIATEEPDYQGGTWLSVDKESITNAKLI